MRIRAIDKQNEDNCGEGNYRVQLYSRRAALVSEFCLSGRDNKIADIDAAEQLLRQSLTPRDFAAISVTLIGDEGSFKQDMLQFDLDGPE